MTTLDSGRITAICERVISGVPGIGIPHGRDAHGQRPDGDTVIAVLPSPDIRNSAARALHLHGYETADLDLAQPEALSAVRVTGWSPRHLDRRIRDLGLAVDQLERTFPTTITTAVGAYVGLRRHLNASHAESAPANAVRSKLRQQIERAVGPVISPRPPNGDLPEDIRPRLDRSDALTTRLSALLDRHVAYARTAIRQLATELRDEPTPSARERIVAQTCADADHRLRADRFVDASQWADEHLPAGDVVPFAEWYVAEYGPFQLGTPAYPDAASRWAAVQSRPASSETNTPTRGHRADDRDQADTQGHGLPPDPEETRPQRPADDVRTDQDRCERNDAVAHAAVDFPAAPTGDHPIAPETGDRPDLPSVGSSPSRGGPR